MIVRELLEMLDATRPNQLPDSVKMRWINDVEGRVHCEIFGKDPDGIRPLLSEEDVLTVPDAYSELYLLYLSAMVEFASGDRSAYNGMKEDFAAALQRYAKYVIRNK